MLVKVLTGRLRSAAGRPPVPWGYLGGVLVLTIAAVAVAGSADAALPATARRSRSCAISDGDSGIQSQCTISTAAGLVWST